MVRGGLLVGVVSRQRIVETLQMDGNGYMQSIMSRGFQVAQPDDSLGVTFRRHQCRDAAFLVPVLDGERIVGIVTLQNLMHSMGLWRKAGDCSSSPVEPLMAKDPTIEGAISDSGQAARAGTVHRGDSHWKSGRHYAAGVASLAQCRSIACEDTRQTQKLLSHFGIAVPTVSCHATNERQRAEELIAECEERGTYRFGLRCRRPWSFRSGRASGGAGVAAGIPVIPIPGASAVVSALAASGLDTAAFLFVGFPPPRTGERRSFFETLRGEQATMIFYEAPHRAVESLRDAMQVFGAERRRSSSARDHQDPRRVFAWNIAGTGGSCAGRELLRGEMTLLVAGADPAELASTGAAPEAIFAAPWLCTWGRGWMSRPP